MHLLTLVQFLHAHIKVGSQLQNLYQPLVSRLLIATLTRLLLSATLVDI